MLHDPTITILQELYNPLCDQFSEGTVALYEAELGVESVLNVIGKALQEDLWKNKPKEILENRLPCECGNYLRYKGNSSKTITTFYEQLPYQRRYYVCPACGQKRFPQDERLGLEDSNHYSPRVNVVVSRLGAAHSFGQTQELVADLFGFRLSKTSVEDVSEAMGDEIFESVPCHELTEADREPCDRFFILMDGKLIPFQREKPGERTYHECKVATIVILKCF